MRTIAVLNQKGGVGKTTTVTNVAAALAVAGSKVVVIDLDPQAHLTIHLGLEPQAIESGSYKVLTQSATFDGEITMVRPNLWLLPANIDLVGAESELVSVVGRETILREAMEASIEKFDYCFIDCAPSLGLLTLNALAAAEEVLIPLQPHFLALQGFGKLLQTVDLVNKRINPDLKVKGILLCMFDTRASLPNEVKADIIQFLKNARGTNSAWAQATVLPTFIRRNIKLAEAPSYGKTIFEYEPNCNGAEDYRKVGEFIHAQTLGLKPSYEDIDINVESESLESRQQPEYAQENLDRTSTDQQMYQEHQEPQPSAESEQSVYSEESYSEIPYQQEKIPQEDYQIYQQESEEAESLPQPEQSDYFDEQSQKPPFEIRSVSQPDSEEHIEEKETPSVNENPEHEQQW
ncbi:AAA family ATPase [Planctomycetota bacterium]